MGMTPAQLLKNNTLLFDTVFGHVVKPLGANTLMTPGLLLPLIITKDPDSQALPKAIPAVLRVRSTKPDLVVSGTTNSAKVGGILKQGFNSCSGSRERGARALTMRAASCAPVHPHFTARARRLSRQTSPPASRSSRRSTP